MKTVHAHVSYTCERVSEELFQYKYDIAVQNGSFDVLSGNRIFGNFTEFDNHIRSHIQVFYGEQDLEITLSDRCLELKKV